MYFSICDHVYKNAESFVSGPSAVKKYQVRVGQRGIQTLYEGVINMGTELTQ